VHRRSVDEADPTEDFNTGASHLDAQVNFKGSTDLDNGLNVGVRLEIEMPNPGGLDETFVWVKGDFGELRGGNHNSAGYSMISGVPGVGVPINSGWISQFIPFVDGYLDDFRSVGVSTKIDFANDDNGIIYYSPRFSGFQLGVSYHPNADRANQASGVTDTAGTDYHNGVGVGATFVESFNGFDVNLGASYGRAEAGDATVALGGDDQEQVIVSVNLGTAGFSVGGAYGNQLEGRLNDAGTSSNEGENYSVGAAYSTGPWTVGVSYMHGETEDDPTNPNDDEIDAISGGISYALGPGITTDFTVLWADTEDEAGASQDGIAGVVGISVGF
jgi:predicted porin